MIAQFLKLVSGHDTELNGRDSPSIPIFTNRSQGYAAHTKGYNSRVWTESSQSDLSSPSAVAYPTTPEEVAILVRAARACGLAVVSRSGGHNYAGFSSGVFSGEITEKHTNGGPKNGVENDPKSISGEGNGVLVIDLSSFTDIVFDKEIGDGTEIVKIGAGCRLGQVATVLAEKGRALPRA